MKTGSEKKADKAPESKGKMKPDKMHCKACGAHFWVDPDVELAAPDYVCPYCGESKDVVHSGPKERKG